MYIFQSGWGLYVAVLVQQRQPQPGDVENMNVPVLHRESFFAAAEHWFWLSNWPLMVT